MQVKSFLDKLLRLSLNDVSFESRGFESCDVIVKQNLEKVLEAFVKGYNLTLDSTSFEETKQKLDSEFDSHHIGFAYEGSGLCYAIKDLISNWGKDCQLRIFTEKTAQNHDYITTVGAGFAFARIPFPLANIEKYMQKLDPLLAWCIPDGYGFHEGFFSHKDSIDQVGSYPKLLPHYAQQLYDSGIGRSLWWVKGANPIKIKKAIDAFPIERQAEMWCGIGVAVCYAGGTSIETVEELIEFSDKFQADFLSGFPFAAYMRVKGGNPSQWTEEVCHQIIGKPTQNVADIILECLNEVNGNWKGTIESKMKYGYSKVRQKLNERLLDMFWW